MFRITDHIDFDSKGRAVCPFCSLEGKKSKNLSLIPNTDGAYKCHRGCSPDQIRQALGQSKDPQVPAALAKAAPTSASVQVPLTKIVEAADRLINSAVACLWLQERGITLDMVEHFNLGLTRSKCGKNHLPAISIPFPVGDDSNKFFQKKRVAPWLNKDEQPPEYRKWVQYGIPAMVWFTHQPEDPKQTWICAGEWDAMMLGWQMRENSDIAVCTFTAGEGNLPSDPVQLGKLKGELITFYDLDDAGSTGAKKVQTAFPERCRIATVPAPPNRSEGFDVSDSLNAGFTTEDFLEAAKRATAHAPQKKANPLAARVITNRELIERAPDHVDFLIPDLLTEDELFVIAGPPRGGKSLLCMTLVKAIASGGKFLDRPVTQGSVLYINCEDSEAKVKQRQLAQEWDADLPVYWINQFKLSELEYLIDYAQQISDLRIIVLDTFSRVRDDGHTESAAELGRVIEPLQEFAREHKVCVILIHHTSKIDADDLNDPFNAIRGSGAIRATCRGAIILAPGENCYRLISENGHSEKLDLKVRLDPNTLEWQLLGKWNPRIASEQLKEQVLDHLNLVGEATISELAHELNLNANSVKVILWRLQADEMISKTGGTKGNPARYKRGNIRYQPNDLLPNCNSDEQSVIGYPVTEKNITFYSEKVITEQESDHLMITNAENDHFSEGASPVTESPQNAQKPYPVKEKKGNRFGYKPKLEPNARVIIESGRFYGMEAVVESIDADGMVSVRAKNWYVSHQYPPSQLRVIPPSEGEQ